MLPEENRPKDLEPVVEPERPTKTARWFNRVIVAALVVIALGVGIFLKWSLESNSVLVVNNSPFPARVVSDPSGDTGGIVFLTADYCKNSDLEGSIRMSYVSKSNEFFLPITPEKLSMGCKVTDVPVVIPKDLPKDTYKIKFRVTYDINPLKNNVMIDFESRQFEVGSK